MSILALTRREFAPGTFFGLLTLALVLAMMAASVALMPQPLNPRTYRAPASSLMTEAPPLPSAAPITVLSSAAGPPLAHFPLAADNLLQFTSEGHVLGFRDKDLFIAGGDHTLKVEFVGGRSSFEQVQGKPGIWGLRLGGGSPLAEVTYPDVWDGVTVVYEKSHGAIVKSTYHVAPGTHPTGRAGSPADRIRLRYNVPVRVDGEGNLVMSFETGEMRESAPVAWQEKGGRRVPVEAAYRLLGERDVGFKVGDHDAALPLVIDPKLVWNTFMGSTGLDECKAITVDLSGNVYVVGHSPTAWGEGTPIINHAGGGEDAFAAKLDSNGKRIWHTFLGSAGGNDYASCIAADSHGNAYITGHSADDWGVPLRRNAHSGAGSNDAFVAKLDASGNRMWNTFMGSAGDDRGYGIAIDGGRNVYVVGPSTDGVWVNGWAVKVPAKAHSGGGVEDAFVSRLDANGDPDWFTFLGSTALDVATGLTVEGSSSVYVLGYGAWADEPWITTALNGHAGGRDVFVAKLNSGNGAESWHTFMGCGGDDASAGRAATDAKGNLFVSGHSPATWGTPVNGHSGGSEAFASKLDAAGNRIWSTFLGGGSNDYAGGIAVDRAGNACVVGHSQGTWGSPLNPYSGSNDVFVARLSPDGKMRWNSFLGGLGGDVQPSVTVDDVGYLYACGSSDAGWGMPLNGYKGGGDGFACKLPYPMVKARQSSFSPVHNLQE